MRCIGIFINNQKGAIKYLIYYKNQKQVPKSTVKQKMTCFLTLYFRNRCQSGQTQQKLHCPLPLLPLVLPIPKAIKTADLSTPSSFWFSLAIRRLSPPLPTPSFIHPCWMPPPSFLYPCWVLSMPPRVSPAVTAGWTGTSWPRCERGPSPLPCCRHPLLSPPPPGSSDTPQASATQQPEKLPPLLRHVPVHVNFKWHTVQVW